MEDPNDNLIAAVQPVRAFRSSVAAVLLFSPQEPLNSANFIIIKRTFFMRRHAIRIFGNMGEEICPDEDAERDSDSETRGLLSAKCCFPISFIDTAYEHHHFDLFSQSRLSHFSCREYYGLSGRPRSRSQPGP